MSAHTSVLTRPLTLGDLKNLLMFLCGITLIGLIFGGGHPVGVVLVTIGACIVSSVSAMVWANHPLNLFMLVLGILFLILPSTRLCYRVNAMLS